jgi:DNA-binding transcriptional LysR family regulator
MQLEQLKAFVIAAQEGSFSGAARKLGKAQSSVSALIQNLEIDLGISLFDRSSRNPVLSPEGEAILREVRVVLQSMEIVQVKSRGLSIGVESHLTLAVDEAMYPMAQLMPVLEQFRERFPSTQLVLLIAPHTGPAELIQQDDADLGIIRSTEDYPEEFHFRGIGSTEFVTVCGSDHPLANLESVTEEDLFEQCHVRITSPRQRERRSDSEISHQRMYVDSYSHLVDLVIANFGWAQVPPHLIERPLREGSLVRIESLYQSVPYVCATDLIWHRNKQLGGAGRWLRDVLSGA